MSHIKHPVISNEIVSGVRGFNLCAYLVALEGWRRGLTLKWYSDISTVSDIKKAGYNHIGKTFSLHSDNKVHYFYRSRGDGVANSAVDICKDKEETKRYLLKAGINVPTGSSFSANISDDLIFEYAERIGYPVVLKPKDGSLGKGVYSNLKNKKALQDALDNLRSEFDYSEYMVEKYIHGKEYRVYVVGSEIVGVINRIPANIVGDGVHTIKTLIDIKNEDKKKNPYLSAKPIKIDFEIKALLKEQGYTLDSIPDSGVVVFLREKSNLSSGGDPIDATDDLPNHAQKVAIDSLKAIPGLPQAGIDLIVDHKTNKVTVLEINATAEIGLHVFPMHGKPRHIPSFIIDYYFPETKGKDRLNTRVYFDFNKIYDLMMSKYVTEYEVPKAPNNELIAKKYIVSGNVHGVGYSKWIRNQALKHKLNGFVRIKKNGDAIIVVAGTDKNIVEQFKHICSQGPDMFYGKLIEESNWHRPVKIGFEIKEKSYEVQYRRLAEKIHVFIEDMKELREENKRLKLENEHILKQKKNIIKKQSLLRQKHNKLSADIKKIKKERDQFKKKYLAILNSRTWRYTAPIRKIISSFKNK